MSDPDKTQPQGSLRRVTLIASAAAAAIVAVLLGAIVAFQGSDNVLSPEQVAQQLAADSSAKPDDHPSGDDLSPSPAGTPSAEATPLPGGGTTAGTQVFDTVGATVTLTCDGPHIVKASWVIKPGYRLDDRTQNTDFLWLKIESDTYDDLLVKAACQKPVVVTVQPDDHGGGSGGGKGKG